MYKPLEIDRENISLMGIKFPDLKSLEATANAIGSNMFEGFEPTPKLIQLYLEWKLGHISSSVFFERLKKYYELSVS
jgi:putative transcriptional regulator